MKKFSLEEKVFIIFNPRDLIDYDEDGNIVEGTVDGIRTVSTVDFNDTKYESTYTVGIGFDSTQVSEDNMFRTREEAKKGALELVNTEIEKSRNLLIKLKRCRDKIN